MARARVELIKARARLSIGLSLRLSLRAGQDSGRSIFVFLLVSSPTSE